MPVTFSNSSFASGGMQGDLGLSDQEADLHHILSEVLCQPWCGPLVKSLGRSGFNEVQDAFFMNQAERQDMLTFLDANDIVTPLPYDKKEMILNLKLFSCFYEENDKPIIPMEINAIVSPLP